MRRPRRWVARCAITGAVLRGTSTAGHHDVARHRPAQVPDAETTFPLNECSKPHESTPVRQPAASFEQPSGPRPGGAGPPRSGAVLTWVGEPENHPAVHRLLDICSSMNIAYGRAQYRAGRHTATIGLAGHNLISPATFTELELPRARAFCEAMRQRKPAAGCTPAGTRPGCCPADGTARPASNWTRPPTRCRANGRRTAARACSACWTRSTCCATGSGRRATPHPRDPQSPGPRRRIHGGARLDTAARHVARQHPCRHRVCRTAGRDAPTACPNLRTGVHHDTSRACTNRPSIDNPTAPRTTSASRSRCRQDGRLPR